MNTRTSVRFNDVFYRISSRVRGSISYRNWAKEVVTRDNGICRKCGQHGNNVHHIKSMKRMFCESLHFKIKVSAADKMQFHKDLFRVGNGILLCNKCHCLEHSKREKFMEVYSVWLKSNDIKCELVKFSRAIEEAYSWGTKRDIKKILSIYNSESFLQGKSYNSLFDDNLQLTYRRWKDRELLYIRR